MKLYDWSKDPSFDTCKNCDGCPYFSAGHNACLNGKGKCERADSKSLSAEEMLMAPGPLDLKAFREALDHV